MKTHQQDLLSDCSRLALKGKEERPKDYTHLNESSNHFHKAEAIISYDS
jgi:hypothetical protein